MRILILINMYPPFSDGGYALECEEVVTELRHRGHEVAVLTSNRDLDGRRVVEDGVWRIFEYCPENRRNQLASTKPTDLWRWYRREWIEHTLLRRALEEFEPEVIHVWTTWGLSYSLATHLARYPAPFCGYVSAYYIKEHNNGAPRLKQYRFWHWNGRPGPAAFAKGALRKLLAQRIPLDHEPLLFDALAFNASPIAADHAGLEISRTVPERIVDSVALERFASLPLPDLTRPRRILFIGRLHPVKDPLTLIRACARLQSMDETGDLELTLVGWRHDSDYVKLLEEAIRAAPGRIRLEDPVDYDCVPALLARHDVLVVPSQIDPLPRAAVEGMAAGLPVVVSGNTGISELITDGEHALVFPAGDVEVLARTLRTLMLDAGLARKLQCAGREHAAAFFSTERMVDDIESFLVRAVERFRAATVNRARTGRRAHPRAITRDRDYSALG